MKYDAGDMISGILSFRMTRDKEVPLSATLFLMSCHPVVLFPITKLNSPQELPEIVFKDYSNLQSAISDLKYSEVF